MVYSLPLTTSRGEVIDTHEITAKEMDNLSVDQIIEKLAVGIILSGKLKEE
jgi:hypothetical protein